MTDSPLNFDKFLDGLDGSYVFLKSDVDELSAYRYTLGDALKAGDVTPGFEIYNRYYSGYSSG